MLQNMQNFLMCGPIHLQIFHCSSAAQGSPHKLNLLFTACLKPCDSIILLGTYRRNFRKELRIFKKFLFSTRWNGPNRREGPFLAFPYLSRDKNRNFLRKTACLTAQERKKPWYFLEIFWLFQISWLNLENHYIIHSIQKTSKLTALQSKLLVNL